MGELRVIGMPSSLFDENIFPKDLTLGWRKDNAEETAFAAKIFANYVTEGWLAIGETSGDKKLIFTFDPDLEKITLIPVLEGG